MNKYSLLDLTLRDIVRVINPTQDDWNVRFHMIEEIRAIVESVESLRGATAEPFGSFVSNLFTRWGDLDISLELPNGSYISSPGRKYKQTLLGDLLKAFRKKGSFRKLQFVSNARVPILKLEGSYNISCDISVNNLSGQMKSKMLFWINVIDARFRTLVLLVKEWAKAHHINDSKSGTLNSYSLSLLVVFHLQTIVPAILPPLREIYPGNMIDDLTGVRAVAEKHIEDNCAANINRIKFDKSRLINKSSMSELFISFLVKFSDICSRASTQGISPYTGQWDDIESNMRWLPKTYALFVEDPFEQPANTARTVSSKQLIKISEAIEATHKTLVSPNQNRDLIMSFLVRPYTSQYQLRPPTVNPVGPHPVSRPPFNRTRNGTHPARKQTPSPTQQPSQTKKPDKRQNGTANGSSQASTSQKQQIWRPRNETKVDQSGLDS